MYYTVTKELSWQSSVKRTFDKGWIVLRPHYAELIPFS